MGTLYLYFRSKFNHKTFKTAPFNELHMGTKISWQLHSNEKSVTQFYLTWFVIGIMIGILLGMMIGRGASLMDPSLVNLIIGVPIRFTAMLCCDRLSCLVYG